MATVLRARAVAISEALIHRGPDEVVDLIGQLANPVGAVPVVPVNVVAFQVPVNLVFLVDEVTIWFSEPMVPMSINLGWYLTINDNRLPYFNNTAAVYNAHGHGNLASGLVVRRLWVQSQEVFALTLYPIGAFGEQCLVMGRIAGRLFKPGTPEVMGL